jgi:hypothetical protein
MLERSPTSRNVEDTAHQKGARRIDEVLSKEARCKREADARPEARSVHPVVVEWSSLSGLFCGSDDGIVLFLFWVLAGIGRMLPGLAERPRLSITEDHRCAVHCVRIVQTVVAAFGLGIAGKSGELESLWDYMIDSGADQAAVAVA